MLDLSWSNLSPGSSAHKTSQDGIAQWSSDHKKLGDIKMDMISRRKGGVGRGWGACLYKIITKISVRWLADTIVPCSEQILTGQRSQSCLSHRTERSAGVSSPASPQSVSQSARQNNKEQSSGGWRGGIVDCEQLTNITLPNCQHSIVNTHRKCHWK